jgi:hypothetical protein
MKIEFKKEIKPNYEVFYFTSRDGRFIAGSLDFDKDKAYERYLTIVEREKNPQLEQIETLETTEI